MIASIFLLQIGPKMSKFSLKITFNSVQILDFSTFRLYKATPSGRIKISLLVPILDLAEASMLINFVLGRHF